MGFGQRLIFVVRLDERDDARVTRWGEPAQGGGDAEVLRRPAHVDDDEVDAGWWWLGVEGVLALADGDARVLTEGPREDAVAGVDGGDVARVAFEEAVGEAAGGAAEVGAGEAGG